MIFRPKVNAVSLQSELEAQRRLRYLHVVVLDDVCFHLVSRHYDLLELLWRHHRELEEDVWFLKLFVRGFIVSVSQMISATCAWNVEVDLFCALINTVWGKDHWCAVEQLNLSSFNSVAQLTVAIRSGQGSLYHLQC